jgi:hypothetical protein
MWAMVSRRAVTALLFALMIPFALSAQQSAEFGRSTGGEMVLTPKGSAPLSGSLELSMSAGGDVFGRSSSPSYGMTAGGTLIQDRLWFFASGSRQEWSPSRFAGVELPANVTTRAIGARVHGQLADSHDFSAYFDAARRPELSISTIGASSFAGSVPSSFLSLRYTGIVSSNMFFSASFSRSSRTMSGVRLVPAE